MLNGPFLAVEAKQCPSETCNLRTSIDSGQTFSSFSMKSFLRLTKSKKEETQFPSNYRLSEEITWALVTRESETRGEKREGNYYPAAACGSFFCDPVFAQREEKKKKSKFSLSFCNACLQGMQFSGTKKSRGADWQEQPFCFHFFFSLSYKRDLIEEVRKGVLRT